MKGAGNLPTIDQALHQAITLHQAGQLQDAERLYRAIIEASPNHPDANHNMGVLAVQVNQIAAGVPYFKAALEANPNNGQYWLSYIDVLIRAGQQEAARQVFVQGRQQGLQGDAVQILEHQLFPVLPTVTPQAPSQRTRHAQKSTKKLQKNPHYQEMTAIASMFNQGRYAEADTLARQLVRRFPDHGFGWKALGVVTSKMGHTAESLRVTQKAATLLPNDAEIQNNLGNTFIKLAQINEAEASYRRAIAIKPDYAEAYNNLGISLKELGRLDEAEASCRRAIAIKPDYAEAYNNLGISLKELGRLDEAEASCRRAIAIKPDYAEAYNNLGISLKELGRLDEAEASYRRAIAIKLGYAEAHSNLGNILKQRGQFADADTSYRRALEINPDSDEFHSNFAEILKEQEKFCEAEAFLRKCISLKPDNISAVAQLGLLLNDMQRFEESLMLQEALLNIDCQKSGKEDLLVIAVNVFIANWVRGNLVAFNETAQKLRPLTMKKNRRKDSVFGFQTYLYWIYLSVRENILLYNALEKEILLPLYTIGESHSLSPCNVILDWNGEKRLVKAVFMMGVCMSHLSKQGLSYRRTLLERYIASLPDHADFLMAIGELDCRIDENGFWHAIKEGNKPILGLIRTTVLAYLDWVEHTLSGKTPASVTIQGIPAPGYSLDALKTLSEQKAFLNMIQDVNCVLKKETLVRNWSFLDVYTATADSNGLSNKEWHLETHHLNPLFYVKEASNWLFLPTQGEPQHSFN